MDFTYLRPGKVWAALEGHPDRPSLRTVERWCSGKQPPPQWAELVIAEKLGTQQSAPAWAEALARDTALSVIEALAPADVQAAAVELIARLEGTQPLNGGAPRVAAEELDQAGLGQPRRARE